MISDFNKFRSGGFIASDMIIFVGKSTGKSLTLSWIKNRQDTLLNRPTKVIITQVEKQEWAIKVHCSSYQVEEKIIEWLRTLPPDIYSLNTTSYHYDLTFNLYDEEAATMFKLTWDGVK